MKVFTECPHCEEEIELTGLNENILIGEEGSTTCPSCGKSYDYEIRVLTTKQGEAE